MRLHWEAQNVSDDRGRDARREIVHVASDAEGCEWIVSPHDDGTWNWQRWSPGAGGEPLAMGEGFARAELAQDAAERYAAQVLT